jgi:aspartyl-tRNA(Asn)/glutamyl-tRNA(Gln) amidotransferase subunit C
MKITREQVEHIAMLARLELSDQEAEEYTQQLNAILDYAAILERLDTQDIEPAAHVMPLVNVMREDCVQASMERESILSNAKEAVDGYFKVPKIV